MLFSILFALSALACDLETLPQVFPAPAHGASLPATASFALDGNMLRAHFEVKSASIYGKPKLGPNEYPYMFDVAEVFVSAEGGVPYYEFELSPFDQVFDVRISYKTAPPPSGSPEPQKIFQNNVGVGIEHKVSRGPTGWTADMGIPLDRIGWKGDSKHVTGNAFVILGQKANKRYFSRSLPVQDKPNFHLPAFFKPLLCDAPAATTGTATQATPSNP